jgi:A/G-specific adenine glycosylase
MLQQTTVSAVIPYYLRWLKAFPDVASLARARLQEVLKTWQGLGYYQRAQNLHAAAGIFAKKFRGKIPRDFETLIKIPGFGPYTTAAVLSLAYNEPHPVLDANVRRVMMRISALRGQADGRRDGRILAELRAIIPKKSAGSFNQAMMEFGALVCKSRSPECLGCPVLAFCLAFELGEQEVIPLPRKRSFRRISAVVGIIEKDGRYFIQKRPSSGLLAGLWEFPGGKVRPGESFIKALAREIKEELGAEVAKADFLIKVEHFYTTNHVMLRAYRSRLKGRPRMTRGIHKWVALGNFHKYPFPSGSAKIVRFLENKS